MTRTTSITLVRSALSGAFALGLVAAPKSALAQSTFGKQGSIVISAERLTGLYYNKINTDSDGFDDGEPLSVETETGGTTVAFLGGGLDAGPAGVPRAAFDYFFLDSMSGGLSLTFGSRSATEEITRTQIQGMGPQTSVDEVETSQTLFAVAPRFGYAIGFTNLLGLWAHGALTYTRLSTEVQTRDIVPGGGVSQTETSVGVFGFAVDAELTIAPVEHVAFRVGPLLEFAPFGDVDYRTTPGNVSLDGDANIFSLGLSAGLSAWF